MVQEQTARIPPDTDATVYDTHFLALAPKYFSTAYEYRYDTGNEKRGEKAEYDMLAGIPPGQVKVRVNRRHQRVAVDRQEERCQE